MNTNLRWSGPLLAVSIAAPLTLSGDAQARRHRHCPPRTIDPIVSTQWLSDNAAQDDLVVLDVRPAEAYAAGHIPGSISEPFVVPFSAWITLRDDLLLELPEPEQLFDSIGALGIDEDSRVVVVTSANPGEPPAYGFTAATRVAGTLLYAGVRQVSVLDGGFPKWESDGRPVTTEVPTLTPVDYFGELDQSIFVDIEYVEDRLGEVAIVDARDANIYFGAATEPFADQAGHIPTASSLPAPWIWHPDGTYLDVSQLAAMADGVIQQPHRDEVIVYCGVGGYSSAWWYLLSQVLGYKKVRFYDGAAQEWSRVHGLVPYKWE